MLVCAFLCATLHTRPRVQRAPGFPCALFFREGQCSGKPRTHGVARIRTYVDIQTSSLRANGSRECAPDDRLREAIHGAAQRKNGLLRRFAPRNDGAATPAPHLPAAPPT